MDTDDDTLSAEHAQPTGNSDCNAFLETYKYIEQLWGKEEADKWLATQNWT